MSLAEAHREVSKRNSWMELNVRLEKLAKSEHTKLAGDVFELVNKHFLLTDSRYQSILTNVWLLNEVPEAIKIKLNLPDGDEGIDLIAETKLGKFWAIQSKYRSNPDETLTLSGKGGLATFNTLAFSYCKNISHGLVLTTVNKPPKKMKLIKKIGFETLESFLSLDDNEFEGWKILVGSSLKRIIKPIKFTPRPHQVQAINNSKKYFETNDRGKIIMPCGTGKSLVAFWIAQEMQANTILVAVPSLALINQTLKVWTREFLINDIYPIWLCVCSDKTVKENQDSFVSFTYDLGIEVTTDKEEISNFLNKKTSNPKIIFTTYQSAKTVCEGSEGFTYDLAIMDEAHKTVGHMEKLSASFIHRKNISVKKRLFMTATERLFRSNINEYLSMDSYENYGDFIYQLSFKKAIEAVPPIISDYKIITFDVTDQDIQKIHNDNKFIRVKKELANITAREFATAIALRKAIKKLNIKNAISFHSTVLRAQNFQKQQEIINDVFPEYKNINTFHVRGDMPVSKRASQMRLFAETQGLLTNCRCLTEGVDLPAIDCVCFTDPKRSKIDIVQAAGRALRLSGSTGKKFGYILVPLFVPGNSDPETASKDSAFEEVISVIGALSTQDSRIKEYLKAISLGKKPAIGNKADGIISINILTEVDSEKFNKAILIKVWDKIARVNYMSFEEAKEMVKKFNIKHMSEYQKLKGNKTLPPDIPYAPSYVYREYTDWYDFTGRIRPIDYRPYEEAKKLVQSLNIRSLKEYTDYFKKNPLPPDMPNHLPSAYEGQYEGRDGFFVNLKKINFSFDEAKKFIFNKKIKTRLNYLEYNQKGRVSKIAKGKSIMETKNIITGLPKNPERFYKKQWKGWSDFLSGEMYGYKNRKLFISYEEAKKIVQSLNIKDKWEYPKLIIKKNLLPKKIPIRPESFYQEEWEGWPIFLGNVKKKRGPLSFKQLSYEEAKKLVHKFNFKTVNEYKKYAKEQNLTAKIKWSYRPELSYINEWKGWRDFLGNVKKN